MVSLQVRAPGFFFLKLIRSKTRLTNILKKIYLFRYFKFYELFLFYFSAKLNQILMRKAIYT